VPDKAKLILIGLVTFSIGLILLSVVLLSADLWQVKQYLTQLCIGSVFVVVAYKLAFSLFGWAGLIIEPLVFGIGAMKSAARKQSS
tara:strand:+ start:718 stop:975 length:258 start_codon:yes stop_codon:yes gene_type:complete